MATLLYVSGQGTYIDDFQSADTNRLSFADSAVTTTYRARNASNVATLTTATAHGLAISDAITVSGVGGTGYNGNYTVSTVPTTTTFTYANTGSEETQTADTAGTIYDTNVRTFPYVAVLTLNFGDNLKNDSVAKFWVFFTDDDAGTNQGYDYGTANAILVNRSGSVATTTRARADNVATIGTASAHGLAAGEGVDVSRVGGTGYNGDFIVASVADSTHFTYANTGSAESEIADTGGAIKENMVANVGGQSSIQYSFDYDSNLQRGAGSGGDDAPITVVAVGLSTAQFVLATGTIVRSIANVVSLVAALERNYSNP